MAKPHSHVHLLVVLLLCAAAYTVFAKPIYWQSLTPGLEYTVLRPPLGYPYGKLHAFRIDLNYYSLDLAFNKLPHVPLQDLVMANKAVVGTNGGFFATNYEPLGLRIKNGAEIKQLRPISWWGVFYINNHHAKIVSQRDYVRDKTINFAVQSGPRLLVNNQIPALKDGNANRTALGITRSGKVILLVTENFPITTTQLAKIMRAKGEEGGLDCRDALNLDGGQSTQLFAKWHDFVLSVPSFINVADVILVTPQTH